MKRPSSRFKDLADKKKHVFDEDIAALVDDEIMRGQDAISDQGVCASKAAPASMPVAPLTLDVSRARNASVTTER